MIINCTQRIVCAFALLIILASCAIAPEAYVSRPYEINREDENFPYGPDLEQNSEITICYAKSGTTPSIIKELANEECGRFGLRAEFGESDMGICPLMTPSAAKFLCKYPEGYVAEDNRQESPSVLFRGARTAPVPGSVLPPSFSGLGSADVSTTAKSAPYPTYLFDGKKQRP